MSCIVQDIIHVIALLMLFAGGKHHSWWSLLLAGYPPFLLQLADHVYEPPHDKTNKVACAPSKDSDQPGHLPSLIRVFPVHMKRAWVLSYPMSTQGRLWIRLGRCLGWSESLLGTHATMLVLSWGSWYLYTSSDGILSDGLKNVTYGAGGNNSIADAMSRRQTS